MLQHVDHRRIRVTYELLTLDPEKTCIQVSLLNPWPYDGFLNKNTGTGRNESLGIEDEITNTEKPIFSNNIY